MPLFQLVKTMLIKVANWKTDLVVPHYLLNERRVENFNKMYFQIQNSPKCAKALTFNELAGYWAVFLNVLLFLFYVLFQDNKYIANGYLLARYICTIFWILTEKEMGMRRCDKLNAISTCFWVLCLYKRFYIYFFLFLLLVILQLLGWRF